MIQKHNSQYRVMLFLYILKYHEIVNFINVKEISGSLISDKLTQY